MKTPTCPGCGAKFSHSNAMKACVRCGLPDEVRDRGGQAIVRWKKESKRPPGTSKSESKRTPIGGSAGRRRMKHGRRGVKR